MHLFLRDSPQSKGFTIIELLICLAIASTLMAIAIPNYITYREKVKITAAISDLKYIQNVIKIYQIGKGDLPDTLEQVHMANFKDPWGNPYQYLRIEEADAKAKGKMRKDHSLVPVNSDFDLYSMGPDGESKPPFTAKVSQDDIVRAGDGSYFGLASGY
ncbi:MAG: prepilin-type N-terminal cleavage/methylation domain-containing protein [Desulfobacteraceae bacterium]|jgi:general secretion pathway protein G